MKYIIAIIVIATLFAQHNAQYQGWCKPLTGWQLASCAQCAYAWKGQCPQVGGVNFYYNGEVYGAMFCGNYQTLCDGTSGLFGGNCNPNPCQNGGTCTSTTAGYTCACINGFTGSTCATPPVPTCTPNPCQNGGSCSVATGQVVCTCAQGWTGALCAVPNYCDPSPCAPGASSCTNTPNNQYSPAPPFTCNCLAGFTDQVCSTNLCNPTPCVHGTCNPGSNSFTCTCSSGWTGTLCDQVFSGSVNAGWCAAPGGLGLTDCTQCVWATTAAACPSGYSTTSLFQTLSCGTGQTCQQYTIYGYTGWCKKLGTWLLPTCTDCHKVVQGACPFGFDQTQVYADMHCNNWSTLCV